jgi:hypothetical protein
MKPAIRCKLLGLYIADGSPFYVARIRLYEPHRHMREGDEVRTSNIQMIDFERGVLITQNTVYLFN